MPIDKIERKERIVSIVDQKRSASIEELCAILEASEATIRRDLSELAEAGLLRRVHGGASARDDRKCRPLVVQRGTLHGDEKKAIGRKAAGLVNDGETVFLGGGSTVLEVARGLVDRRDLHVITNSLPVVNLLVDAPGIHLVASGGFLRYSEQTFVGFLVELALSELRADKVIFGTQGIHPEHGLTDDWLPETTVDRAIVRFAPELIVVADSSKFGRTRLSFVTGLSNVSAIVTDGGIDPAVLKDLTERGVRVVIAENQPPAEPTGGALP